MTNPNRTPAGLPTGGQFAASERGEASTALDVDQRAVRELAETMGRVESFINAFGRSNPAEDLLATPEGAHRDDMPAINALAECHDLWASGAWDDRNATYDREEVERHLKRLGDGDLNEDGHSYDQVLLADEHDDGVHDDDTYPGCPKCERREGRLQDMADAIRKGEQ